MTTPRNTLNVADEHTRNLFTQLARIAARHFDPEHAHWSDLLLDAATLQAAVRENPEGGHVFIGFRAMGTVLLSYCPSIRDHTFYRVDWVDGGDGTTRWIFDDVAAC